MPKYIPGVKKVVAKIDHGGKLFTHIPAQMAGAGPPLGTQLGRIGINVANFVKDFNLRTSIFKQGVPIPMNVKIKADRTYDLQMNHPPFPYFIKQAAGINRGAMNAHHGELAGLISRKHVYEIAKLKSEDPEWQMVDLKKICEKVIDRAYDCGVYVVDELDPVKYEKFLADRAVIIEQQLQELKEQKEAKLLRTAVADAKAAANA